jgi:hypothetical protein
MGRVYEHEWDCRHDAQDDGLGTSHKEDTL